MKRSDLHIPEPCSADWDAMTGDEQKRFCDACTKHVHNLSEMTRDDAKHLLNTNPNLCIQYHSNTKSGEVYFKDSDNSSWRMYRQMQGAKKLLAAALSIPMLAGVIGCDEQQENLSPDAVPPVIQINPDGTLKTNTPGSGLQPTPPTPPTTNDIEATRGEPEIIEELGDVVYVEEEKPAEDDVHMVKGEIAPVQHTDPAPEGKDDTEACDKDSEKDTSAHTNTLPSTLSPTIPKPSIKMGKVAPSHIKK